MKQLELNFNKPNTSVSNYVATPNDEVEEALKFLIGPTYIPTSEIVIDKNLKKDKS